MMLGLPGSGKTTFSKDLQLKLSLKRFSVDEEYSRMGGDLSSPDWDKALATKAGTYIRDETAKEVSQGQSVILDLCPWMKNRREEYREFIKSIGGEPCAYYFDVDKEELNRRLAIRNASGDDFYIISSDMLDDFIEEFDIPINEDVVLISSTE